MNRYRQWCGTRSFIFQVCLLVWTIIMLGFLVSLVNDARVETDHYVNIREMSPKQAETEVGASACCPIGLWAIVALPLGIAAIATLGRVQKG